jgi:hypothetical protein
MASGMFFDQDGVDRTMDVLGQAVEEMDSHPCPYVTFKGNRNPDYGFEPDETCDADTPDSQEFCDAHAWAS